MKNKKIDNIICYEPNDNNLDKIVNELKNNKVAIIPTDTVWGIVSLNPDLIYQVKNRPKEKKLISFVNDIDELNIDNIIFNKLANKFWPGPLTLIYQGISYRKPNSDYLLNIIKKTGPLYSSSANISGQNPITNKEEAVSNFSNYINVIIFINGKYSKDNNASTIYDIDKRKIIRQGAITMSDLKNVLNTKIKVYIGSDHGGFEMKEKIRTNKELNEFLEFEDVGTYSTDSVDYPDYAEKIGKAVRENKGAYGIGICGTGIGICISLNKINGIYAANVNKIEEAKLAKAHNNVNVITLSGRFTTFEDNVKIIKAFFNEKFEAGRHVQRLEKIYDIERKNHE